MKIKVIFVLVAGLGRFWCAAGPVAAGDSGLSQTPLEYINTAFENASPLYWEIEPDGAVAVSLVYDHERGTVNRANGHWYFQLEARPGSELTLILKNFDNIWNGRMGSPISERTNCYISANGAEWKAIRAEKTADNLLKVNICMEARRLFVARLEPYTVGDFDRFLADIGNHRLVEITPIGRTVEGRRLEMIRIGSADAPYSVLIRARAHPWEAGGNWVVDGLIKSLLKDGGDNKRYLKKYCLYVMGMANKDGVAHGRTRFNLMGMDLNRNWDKPADPKLSPENHALESWLDGMVRKGKKPDLAIDLHNDNGGRIHISRPDINLDRYLANMERIEKLLVKHTWFTEGSTGKNFRNPGTIGEGLLERYGIDAFVYELNCDWIAGLKKTPFAEDWRLLGRQLRDVFYEYFQQPRSE